MDEATHDTSRPAHPGVGRWIKYAFGGALPERFDSWVLYDVTGRTWLLRHLARTLVQLCVPIVAVAVFVPGPAAWRVAIALGGTFLAMIFSFAYVVETSEHRLVKAGYAAGTGQRMRGERALQAQYESAARARERIAARRNRRGW